MSLILMVHNSLTVRRFIVTSTLCSLGACHQTGKANCATPPTPLTGNRCPNDIRPVADPLSPSQSGRGCTHMNVSGPRSQAPGRVACDACQGFLCSRACWAFSECEVLRGHRFDPTNLPHSQHPLPSPTPSLPQHFVLITKSLSERTKLVEES